MFKRISSIVLMTLVLSSSSFAMDLYVKVAGGTSSVKGNNVNATGLSFSNESIYTIALGTKVSDFDIEVEYTYEKNKFNTTGSNFSASGKAKGFNLNAFYNIDLDYVITPYVGVGLGNATYKFNSVEDNYIVYQAMLGAKYAVNENIDLGLEYRYKDTSNSAYDFSSNNLLVNASYKF